MNMVYSGEDFTLLIYPEYVRGEQTAIFTVTLVLDGADPISTQLQSPGAIMNWFYESHPTSREYAKVAGKLWEYLKTENIAVMPKHLRACRV